MKKKQVLATLCAGMMVASVATGCGSAAESAADSTAASTDSTDASTEASSANTSGGRQDPAEHPVVGFSDPP